MPFLWPRTDPRGRCRRVIVIAGDIYVTNPKLWIVGGTVASGAAGGNDLRLAAIP